LGVRSDVVGHGRKTGSCTEGSLGEAASRRCRARPTRRAAWRTSPRGPGRATSARTPARAC